jgi:hypothetical protein
LLPLAWFRGATEGSRSRHTKNNDPYFIAKGEEENERILLVNPQVPKIMPRQAFVEGPNIMRIQDSNSSRIAWK